MIIFIILLAIALFVFVVFCLKRKKVFNLFKKGNVIVTGLRGTGKDMLMANVVASRREPYISNIDYSCKHSPRIALDLRKIDIPSSYKNLINKDFIAYDYPYPERCDFYISDAGIYFPSQYQGQLCKEFEGIPYFQALSRHLGDCNFHCNVQNLNRLWDKIREQSDIYIRCISCKVLGKLVIQKVIVYDKYEACLNRVDPFKPLKTPFSIRSQTRTDFKVTNERLLREFKERNGSVRAYTLIYRNKSKYDTRLFKRLLSTGFRPNTTKVGDLLEK